MNLNQTDIATLSTALRELYSHTDAETLPHRVIKLLRQLIAADSAAYNLLDFREQKALIIHDAPPELEAWTPAFEAFLHEHPLVEHQHLRGQWRTGAARISDFVSRRQLRDTGLYQEYFHPLRIEEQLGMYVEEEDRGAITVCLQRDGRTFSERDREILTFLQPHLIQAFKNAADITLAKARATDMRKIAEAAAIGVVWLKQNEEVEYMSSAVSLWLNHYFPSARNGGCDFLPPPLLRWIRRQKTARLQEIGFGWEIETTVRGNRGDLKIRWVLEQEDRSYLIFSENRINHNPADLRPLGLSRRETEVLHWITEGKTNPAIAAILGISKRTVDKHAENILRKLQVETRVEAAARAMQLRV